MNVLQRISICYFLSTLLYIYLRVSTRSIVSISAAILILYYVLMKFVPVPGSGVGVLEPVGNWANYIDQHVMAGHMQHKDWEGKTLLGSLPSLVTMLMGLLAGIYLRTERLVYEKLTHLYLYGSLSMAAGAIWSAWFPINQQLWTSSLVLFMGGVALLGIATFYYLVDVRQSKWWTTPFLIFGMNSIAVWVFSQMGEKALKAFQMTAPAGGAIDYWTAANGFFIQHLGQWSGPLVFASVFELFWLGIMAILYHRRIFIKL